MGVRQLKVAVVSPARAVRDGLAMALESQGLRVVSSIGPEDDLSTMFRDAIPSAVLVDSSSRDGIALLVRVAEVLGAPRVAVGLPVNIEMILAAVKTGAEGLFAADDGLEEIVSGLRAVAQKRKVWSPDISAALIDHVAGLDLGDCQPTSLTKREHEIADLIRRGLSNKEISQTLVISLSTVKTHVHNILMKLQLKRREQIAILVYKPVVFD